MCDETNAITDAMQRVADATLMEVERLREADRQAGRDEERARIERIIASMPWSGATRAEALAAIRGGE